VIAAVASAARRPGAVAAVAFVLLAGAATLVWHYVRGGRLEVVDITRYRDLGERIAGGAVPYRDVDLEYPPGSIVAFALPALVTSSRGAFFVVFSGLMAAVGLAAVLVSARLLRVLGATPGETRLRLALVAATPLALGGVILTRFDLVPVLVLLLALLALAGGRDRLGLLLLGLATATKVYPVVALPIAVMWIWRRSGRRVALTRLAECAAVPVVAYAAFAVMSPGGVADSLWGQLSRPLQIESLASGVLLALHHVAGMSLTWSSGSGSQNLDGTAAAVLAGVSTVVGAAALLLVWRSFWRGPATPRRLVRHAAGSVVAFVAFSKVLSPQYLVWLVFLVPFVLGPGSRAVLGLLAAACAATAVWFPGLYWALVKEFDPVASAFVLVRDLLLVALLVVLAVTDAEREPPRSRLPVPSPGHR